MPYSSRKELRQLAQTIKCFRGQPNHLRLLNSLRRSPDAHGYLYCYVCGCQECKSVYSLEEYHPTENCYTVCSKCLKQYYHADPDEYLPEPRGSTLSLRFRVLERDGFKCVYCGRKPSKDNDVELHVDHMFPKSRGGLDVTENLVTACKECNLGKSDYILKKRRR